MSCSLCVEDHRRCLKKWALLPVGVQVTMHGPEAHHPAHERSFDWLWGVMGVSLPLVTCSDCRNEVGVHRGEIVGHFRGARDDRWCPSSHTAPA